MFGFFTLLMIASPIIALKCQICSDDYTFVMFNTNNQKYFERPDNYPKCTTESDDYKVMDCPGSCYNATFGDLTCNRNLQNSLGLIVP